MASKPMQRTLEHLRGRGYLCAITEHWNAHAMIRQDLFGCIDVLAIGCGEVLAVQTTSDSNLSARLSKILSLPAARLWVQSGARLEVHGWGLKARPWKDGEKRVGKRAKRWELRCVEVTVESFKASIPRPERATQSA